MTTQREKKLEQLQRFLGLSHKLCGVKSPAGETVCWRPRGHKGNHAAWIYEWKPKRRKL